MFLSASTKPIEAWAVGSSRISTPAARMWAPPAPTRRTEGSRSRSARARLASWMSPDVSPATMRIVVMAKGPKPKGQGPNHPPSPPGGGRGGRFGPWSLPPLVGAHFLEDGLGGAHGAHAVLAGDDGIRLAADAVEEAPQLRLQGLLLDQLDLLDRVELLGDLGEVGEREVAVLGHLDEGGGELGRGPVDPGLL